MRIGELARGTGVTPQTIRFYERQGLLPCTSRETNGYRQYDHTAASALQFIRSAQHAGLTLTEISSIITLRQAGQSPCEHVSTLLAAKLHAVQAQQRDLAVLEEELQHLIYASDDLDPADCTAAQVCQIIAH